MVWGCGTFGVNTTELSMFYDSFCHDCDLSDVEFDTEHHGKEGGDNCQIVMLSLCRAVRLANPESITIADVEGTLDTTYISTFGKGTRTLVSNTNVSMATEEGEGQGIATVL